MTRIKGLAVALDTSDWSTFESWCELFGARVEVLKVGLEAFVCWGPRAVARARATGAEVFLDLKLHDIPQTVAGAVRAAAAQGAHYLTVHASGGPEMLRAAADAAGAELRLLAVTVLTHLDRSALDALGFEGELAARALRWASLAHDAGCAGAVCSPHEIEVLRRSYPRDFLLVTPGVRPRGGLSEDDQRRTATPRAALAAGANLLVVGRPLTGAASPLEALAKLERELGAVP